MDNGAHSKSSPAAYVKELLGFLQNAVVTDRAGVTLPFEGGATRAVDAISSVKELGGQVMLVGNGGSAAIVSHAQNDLCKMIGVRAMVFHETPFLTAMANDHGYEEAFERGVRLWADPKNLLIAVSSSGESENILRAVEEARQRECRVITFSGFRAENRLRAAGDINFYIPSGQYGFVEVAHMAFLHMLTDLAAARVAKKEKLHASN